MGRNYQCGVMVEASPTSAFEMTGSDFLLQFEIVPFDAPALFGGAHEMDERDGFIARRIPKVCRRFFVVRPLDQKPLLGNRVRRGVAIVCRVHPDTAKSD